MASCLKNIILPFSFTSYSFSHRSRYSWEEKESPIPPKPLKSLEAKASDLLYPFLLLHFSASNKLLWNYMSRFPSQNIRKHLKALEVFPTNWLSIPKWSKLDLLSAGSSHNLMYTKISALDAIRIFQRGWIWTPPLDPDLETSHIFFKVLWLRVEELITPLGYFSSKTKRWFITSLLNL